MIFCHNRHKNTSQLNFFGTKILLPAKSVQQTADLMLKSVLRFNQPLQYLQACTKSNYYVLMLNALHYISVFNCFCMLVINSTMSLILQSTLESCILDGEMIVVDPATDEWL